MNNEKDILLRIIRHKGDCEGSPACLRCPMKEHTDTVCSNTNMTYSEADNIIYKSAIEKFIKQYGPEELFEELL